MTNIYLFIMELSIKIEKQFVDSKTAASYLGISRQHLRRLCMQRRIPYYKPGGWYSYFKVEDLQKYMEQGFVPVVER